MVVGFEVGRAKKYGFKGGWGGGHAKKIDVSRGSLKVITFKCYMMTS